MKQAKGITAGYWITASLFALQMGFTAYAQLRIPQVAEAFTHLGFPAYFRVELSWLKLAGILVLLLPAPARLKEWAYAGFAITLLSALIAHFAVGDEVSQWSWAAGTAVLWALSYFFFRKLSPGDGRAVMERRQGLSTQAAFNRGFPGTRPESQGARPGE
jgi:DoxX-like family